MSSVASYDKLYVSELAVIPKHYPGDQLFISFCWNWIGPLVIIKTGVTLDPANVYCGICLEILAIENAVFDFETFKTYARYGVKTGTCTLNKHLSLKHGLNKAISIEENQRIVKQLLPVKQPSLTQELFNRRLILLLIKNYLSISFVQNEETLFFFELFLPQFKLPSRSFIESSGLSELYSQVKMAIQRFFQENQISTVTLTIDITHLAHKNDSLVAINAHFIFNHQVNSILLKLRELEHPQTADSLVPIIDSTLDQFFLKGKPLCFTTDEGQNLKSAVKLMRHLRVSCISHEVHNFVSRDLKKICKKFAELILQNRQIYHHLHTRKHLLNTTTISQIVENLHEIEGPLEAEDRWVRRALYSSDDDASSDETDNWESRKSFARTMKKDNSTRWHSTNNSLRSTRDNRRFIENALVESDGSHLIFNHSDWNLLNEFCNLLSIICKYSQLLTVKEKPTIHRVLLYRAEIRSALENFNSFEANERELILQAFDRRVKIEEIHVAASLLDPATRNLRCIEPYLNQRNKNNVQFILQFSKNFNISVADQQTDQKAGQSHTEQSFNLPVDEVALISKHSSSPATPQRSKVTYSIISEVTNYFEQEFHFISCALEFWLRPETQTNFPFLSQLAQIVFSCPATQALTEVTFSKAKLRSTGSTNRLSCVNIGRTEFINQNIRFVRRHGLSTDLGVIDIEANEAALRARRAQALEAHIVEARVKRIKRAARRAELKGLSEIRSSMAKEARQIIKPKYLSF